MGLRYYGVAVVAIISQQRLLSLYPPTLILSPIDISVPGDLETKDYKFSPKKNGWLLCVVV